MCSCFQYLDYISFMCNMSKYHAVVKCDFIHLAGKRQYFFFFFRVQMESILPVEQLMVLSTFLMLLLENWFTPFKVLYVMFLNACDIETCAVVFGHISYNVWCGLNESLCMLYLCLPMAPFCLFMVLVANKIIIFNLCLAYG